jgi:hypothetical protein
VQIVVSTSATNSAYFLQISLFSNSLAPSYDAVEGLHGTVSAASPGSRGDSRFLLSSKFGFSDLPVLMKNNSEVEPLGQKTVGLIDYCSRGQVNEN